MLLCCTLLSQKVWKAIRGKNTRLTHLKFAVQIFFQQFGHFTRLNFLDGMIWYYSPIRKKKFTLTFWDWPIVKLSYLYTTTYQEFGSLLPQNESISKYIERRIKFLEILAGRRPCQTQTISASHHQSIVLWV